MTVAFGDNVRILPDPITNEAGIAGKLGVIYGETVPSSSGVSVLGELAQDYALNVFVEELNQDFWLDPSLVEFIDHGAGTEVTFAGSPAKWVRQSDGSWVDINAPSKPWWRFW